MKRTIATLCLAAAVLIALAVLPAPGHVAATTAWSGPWYDPSTGQTYYVPMPGQQPEPRTAPEQPEGVDTGTITGSVVQRITPVSGGISHSIALKSDGSVWTWGSNQQLGLGQSGGVAEQATPEKVEDLRAFISVSAGYDFSLALRYDGSVYVFGGEDASDASPISQVPDLTGIVAVAASQAEGLALDGDGFVWQWRIGETPRQVRGLKNVAAISAGGAHFLALKASGEVWAWGANMYGQLGNGTKDAAANPVKVEGIRNVVYVAAGFSHTLAVTSDGSVYAWGSNTYGQIGDDTSETRTTPVKALEISNAIQVSAGNEISMALTKNNKIYTWGYGEYGQLGDGTYTISQKKPTKLATEGKPVYIASGVHHNFYIDYSGDLFAWGRNRSNQLGTDTSENESRPKKVLDDLARDSAYKTLLFSDAATWAEPELSALYAMGIVPPMFWDSYRGNVTRGEVAALLVCLYEQLKTDIADRSIAEFEDIGGHLFEQEIQKAFRLKLVNGISPTIFKPDGNITRQEATKMISSFVAKMEDIDMPSGISSLAFYKDASKIAEWAIPFVAFAYDNDIMRGSTDGRFMPQNNLTKDETLVIIYRTIMKYEWA